MSIDLVVDFQKCKNNARDSVRKTTERLASESIATKIGHEEHSSFATLKSKLTLNFFYGQEAGILISCNSKLLSFYEGYTIGNEKIQSLVNTAKLVYENAKPEFGIAAFETEFHYPLKEIFIGWLTFFGPELSEKYGKEKLLSAPAYKVEELSDGGIFIQASYSPALSGFPSKEEIKKRKLKKEDLDLYDEDVMRKKISEYLNIGVKN